MRGNLLKSVSGAARMRGAGAWLLRDWGSGLCSALFHLGLIALPLAAQAIAREAAAPGAYDYTPTEATLASTRAAMDAALLTQARTPARFHAAVHDALETGRADVARGLLLARAGAHPGPDAEKLQAAAPALSFSDRAALAEGDADAAPPPPRETALIVAPLASGEVRSYAADELRALMVESGRWLLGRPTDALALRLTGLQLTSPGDDPLAGRGVLRDAARLIRIARRSGKLDPALEAHVRALAEAALPAEALRARLLAAFEQPFDRQAPTPIADAFALAAQPQARQALEADLAAIAALRQALPQPSALDVLARVDDPALLPRVRLLAEAGGERLPALLALRREEQVWSTARGRLRDTRALRRHRAAAGAALTLLSLSCGAAAFLAWRRVRPLLLQRKI